MNYEARMGKLHAAVASKFKVEFFQMDQFGDDRVKMTVRVRISGNLFHFESSYPVELVDAIESGNDSERFVAENVKMAIQSREDREAVKI